MILNSNDQNITSPVLKQKVNDDYKYKQLPNPPGKYPYRLVIDEIIKEIDPRKMVFHMVGDTGGIVLAPYQQQVIDDMADQCTHPVMENELPLFLYHLGDVVYNYGEQEHYYDQFFKPFEHYPRPIFAIPGNHDGDVNPDQPQHYGSLYTFLKVFCDQQPRPLDLAAETNRVSITQPNVYWTLNTPLATIIGLYSNVTKYGLITTVQRDWFIEELKAANTHRQNKALIVCMHHSPYSADSNHGSSEAMSKFLDGVFTETGIKPDVVFSGHVHNYQRFTRYYDDGSTVPYIVAGGGGYAELHKVINYNDPDYAGMFSRFNVKAQLEKYSDNTHGFLKVTIEKNDKEFYILTEYYALNSEAGLETSGSHLFDSYKTNLRR
jgi:predicted phosphodiesterase